MNDPSGLGNLDSGLRRNDHTGQVLPTGLGSLVSADLGIAAERPLRQLTAPQYLRRARHYLLDLLPASCLTEAGVVAFLRLRPAPDSPQASHPAELAAEPLETQPIVWVERSPGGEDHAGASSTLFKPLPARFAWSRGRMIR